MLYTRRSKCASCDQRNASVYCPDADDMYCYSCYEQKQIDKDKEWAKHTAKVNKEIQTIYNKYRIDFEY